MFTHLRRATARLLAACAVLLALMSTPSAAVAQEMYAAPEKTEQAWAPNALPNGWVVVTHPGVEVVGHSRDVPILDRLGIHAAKSVPEMLRKLGFPASGTIRIYLATTQEQFRDIQPGTPPVWADGVAYPPLRAIFLRHPNIRHGGSRPLEQVLDHELVHILLGYAFAPARPPHWLQEGLAQVYSGELTPEFAHRIASGWFGSDPYTLEQLAQGFPADARGADMAYAQAADFVAWMTEEHGEDTMARLVDHILQGHSLPFAIRDVTGTPIDELDAAWRARLTTGPPSWSIEGGEAALFGIAGVLMLALGMARRRAFRLRMRAWADEESQINDLASEVLHRGYRKR